MGLCEEQVVSLQEDKDTLLEVLKNLLALRVAKEKLYYLHRGIGTATEDTAWLAAETCVNLYGDTEE